VTEPQPTVPAVDTDLSPDLPSEIVHKFLLIFRYLRQYGRQMDDQGIRPREFAILRYLTQHEAVTVGQVQSYLYTSPGTTSTILAQMEEAGYLTRTRSADDNRVVIVEPTEKGREVAQRSPLGGIPLLRARLPELPPEKQRTLDEALAILIDLMEVPDLE
jgi:DNA-binding MarR family transcriptional regulator